MSNITKADIDKARQMILEQPSNNRDAIIIDPDQFRVLYRVFKSMERTINDLTNENTRLVHQIEEMEACHVL